LDDLDKAIPDDAKVRFFDATDDIAKEMGFGDLAYLSTQPTAVLGIIGGTKSEREVKIITILRPVRQTDEAFAFVPYCLTEKGEALFQQKNRTQP
jgi:ABC-type molybdate transport system substrate-binding protein